MKKRFLCVLVIIMFVLSSVLSSCAKKNQIGKDFFEFAKTELDSDEYSVDDKDFFVQDGDGHVLYVTEEDDIKHFCKYNEGNEYIGNIYCSIKNWSEKDVDSLVWYNRVSDNNNEWVMIVQFSDSKKASESFEKFTKNFTKNVGVDVDDLTNDQYEYDGEAGKLLLNLKQLILFYCWLDYCDSNEIQLTYDDAANELELEALLEPESFSTILKDGCIICTHFSYMDNEFNNMKKIVKQLDIDNPKDIDYDDDSMYKVVDYLVANNLGRDTDELFNTLIPEYGNESAGNSSIGNSSKLTFPCTISSRYFDKDFTVTLDYDTGISKNGDHVFIVIADFHNNSKDSFSVFSSWFTCYVDNTACNSEYYKYNDLKTTTEISSGRNGKICACFEIPSDAKTVEVDFNVPNYSGVDTYTITASIG